MTLPPKALQALADIKKELLSQEFPSTTPPAPEVLQSTPIEGKTEPRESGQVMRRARVQPQSWQNFCRRGRRW